jgi:phospholipase/carboxylesterase
MTKEKPAPCTHQGAHRGRLSARPTPVTGEAPPGLHVLGSATKQDGVLYVPAGYHATRPAPLAVMLHGAGGHAQQGLAPLLPFADAAGLLLLAPESQGRTWDLLLGALGPDLHVLDEALRQIFQRYAVDATHLALGGFSDGASYALSVGLTNGDLFTHIIAFSPGFMAPVAQHGAPRLFVSHGVHDAVLPIDACSRRLVPQLRRADYKLCYREFDGPHTVPTAVAREAVAWFTTDSRSGC